MRPSFLSRSVVAVASLAVGSVALAATPATAATPSGVTRDQVLAAAASVRSMPSDADYEAVTEPLLLAIARPSCSITADERAFFDADPTEAGQGADGLLIKAYIETAQRENRTYRQCVVAAVASTNPAMTLSGTLTLNGSTRESFLSDSNTVLPPARSALSGDVFVSPPITVTGDVYVDETSFTATGNGTRDVSVTTTVKVTDKKTKNEKRKAKKAYLKKLKSAKKSYVKALKKAGKSKSKKAAAKKAYARKRVSAKSTYKVATAGYKLVKKTTTRPDNVPFNLSAAIGPPL
jgi:hypothetical protein